MNSRLSKVLELFIHLVAVLVLLSVGINSYERMAFFVNETKGIGLIITTNQDPVFWHVVVYGLYILTWFCAYFGLFKRFQFSIKKKLLAFGLGWVALSAIHILILFLVSKFMYTDPLANSGVFEMKVFGPFNDSLFAFYFVLILIAFLAQTTVQFISRYQELEHADHVQSELALIKSQLRPHFLFNTLNSMYSIALESQQDLLADGIQNLTGLMRYSMRHSTQSLVPLEEEWDYILRYIKLQQLRIPAEQMDIQVDQPEDFGGISIAPMILINFVENAFKHGISYEKHSFIHVSLELDKDYISFKVQNSNHSQESKIESPGLGITQTKKLLDLHYQQQYNLTIEQGQEVYHVHLKLPRK